MESYGALLKQARESKNITIETAAKETAIMQEYLVALEEETTGVFHGEAYITGFMRNYAEYLGLDPQRLLNLYRNTIIQQLPAPEGLFEKPKPAYFIPVIILSVLFSAAVATLLTMYFKVYRPERIAREAEYAVSEKVQQKTYELGDIPLNERLYVGDQIIVPVNGGSVVLTVASDVNSKLGLQTPQGLQYFELSETREIDIDGDEVPDTVIDVWEISSNSVSRGAEVYIVRNDFTFAQETENLTVPRASGQGRQTVVIDDNRAYPFTLTAAFRAPCVFRYEVDRKDSVEGYYAIGDSLTMAANNRTRLWVSNGSCVKFQVIAGGRTHDLEMGKAGEVIAEDIKWVRSDDGRYKLVVEELD